MMEEAEMYCKACFLRVLMACSLTPAWCLFCRMLGTSYRCGAIILSFVPVKWQTKTALQTQTGARRVCDSVSWTAGSKNKGKRLYLLAWQSFKLQFDTLILNCILTQKYLHAIWNLKQFWISLIRTCKNQKVYYWWHFYYIIQIVWIEKYVKPKGFHEAKWLFSVF